MKFSNSNSEIFIPENIPAEQALKRTTHLCIAAHQDDVEIMAYHGIAECYEKQDRWFTAVVMSDGAGSPRAGKYASMTDDQMKLVRKEEQRQAAKIGKYSAMIQLAHPSSEIKKKNSPAISEDLLNIILKTRPETIYLHNLADKHATHVACSLKVIEALREAKKQGYIPKNIWGAEVWRDLDWLPDNKKIQLNTSAYPDLALRLLEIFDSQVAGGKRYDLATLGRRLANATFGQSHSVDEINSLNYAMDLRPLIDNHQLSPQEYCLGLLNELGTEIGQNIKASS